MSPKEQNLTDNQLLQLIAQRNLRALEQFYERHAEVVYGLLLYIVQDRGLADELLQETFLQVWTQAESIDAGRNIALWLYQSARRRSLEALRWSLRDPKQQMEVVERICTQAQSMSRDNGSYDLSATILVDFTDNGLKAQRELTWRSYQAMSEEQRIAVLLAFYAGMNAQEIANYLKLSPVRVQTLINEGIGRLNRISLPTAEAQKERV